MPGPRVICDSEDEDAGFSPVNSPVKADATDCGVALEDEDDTGGQPPQEAFDVSEVRSTDPDFFQRVYDDHQKAVSELVPDSARNGDHNTGSSDRPKSPSRSAKDNSSSLTDPILRSTRKKGHRVNGLSYSPLTQVTTPRDGAPAGKRHDVYDFPSSDDEGDAAEATIVKGKKATKSRTKRKRRHVAALADAAVSSSLPRSSSQVDGLVSTHPRHEGESPQPSRKKRRNGTQQDSTRDSEDVDLLAIPRTADMDESPAKTRVGCEDPGSIIPDTFKGEQSIAEHPPASFFIAPPSRLTASQKQEYVRISGSSEHEGEEHHESLLAVPQTGTQGLKLRSSEATIAYPTPSRYCSTAPPFSDPQESGDRDSSGTAASSRKRENISQKSPLPPHSSPDELNAHSQEHTLAQSNRRRGNYEDDEIAQEDTCGSDADEIPRETYVPRPRRGRVGLPDGSSGRPFLPDAGSGITRKKQMKTAPVVDVAQEDSWDSDKIGAHRESYKPRPSRRRSKTVVPEDTEDAPEQPMPDTCPPGQAISGAMERAEPVLDSSGQQAPRDEAEHIEGIDPDYLAALPKELRQEVIADHLARTSQASRTRGRGRPKKLSSAIDAPPGEVPQPKKRGRKKKEVPSEEVLTSAPDAKAQGMSQSVVPVKKKRGRPRKSETVQSEPAAGADEDISLVYELEDVPRAMDDSTADDSLALESVRDVSEPVKIPSKRGRKKKVVEDQPASPEQEPFEPVADEVSLSEVAQIVPEQTKGPSKRGRKRKVVEEPPVPPIDAHQEEDDIAGIPNMEVDELAEPPLNEPDGSVDGATPLQDISNTASSQDHSLSVKGEEKLPERDVDKQEAASEARTKEIPKSASSTASQGQGKVPYRVGLSKRSRIAPLLKIIRK